MSGRHAAEEPVDLCWSCDEPAVDSGEGRFCTSCGDHEGTCVNDHCLRCGASVMSGRPAVGTVFTLPRDVIPIVRTARWVVTSTTPAIVRYRIVDDPRVGKRPISTSLDSWLRDAEVET